MAKTKTTPRKVECFGESGGKNLKTRIQCLKCDKKFASISTIRRHHKTFHEPTVTIFECLHCPATFTRKHYQTTNCYKTYKGPVQSSSQQTTMAQPSLAKFTDLAELVSKIEEPSPSSNVSQSSFDTDDEMNEVMFNDGNEEDDDDDEYEDEDDDDDDDIDIEDVINADIIEEKEDDLSGDDNKGLSVGISKSDGSLRHRLGKSSDQSV
ncbi:KRAB [Mytilus coruscus]|uniref:KRAB n=1 Tax=Mytilus coruscus TaxID=42192 RepID=A0A6J8B6Y7_MYTCO|nr:KRAB [Mytilus coruscus]